MAREMPEVPSVVALDRAAVGSAVNDALMNGLDRMNARVAAAVIAELFFSERSEADRRDASGQIYDLVCAIADPVAAAHPRELRQTLKTVLADLDYLAEAFEIGRRPRGTRKIGADAWMAITGRVPRSLVPAGGGDVDFADFGRLQIGPLGPSATASGRMIPIDRASGLLPAILDFASADGRVTAIWLRSLSVWPRSLAALGLGPGTLPTRPVYSGRVRCLPDDQQRELAELATAAREWM